MWKNKLLILLLGIICTAGGCAGLKTGSTAPPAGEKRPAPETRPSESRPISALYPFSKHVLPNGLTVIVKEVHAVPIAAVYFWVETGSANEEPRLSGISHFFEHMFFKGTEKRTTGEMDRVIKELGGYNNAFTSLDYTGYYVVVPSANFATAFDILLDAIRNSVFNPEEVERERKVIEEEINLKEDNPHEKSIIEFMATIFKGIPYGEPILGTYESLAGIEREDFFAYLGAFYVPNNMTLVVVGDVDEDGVKNLVEEATHDFLPDPTVEKRRRKFTFIPQEEKREASFFKDVNQAYLIAGFPHYGLQQRDELYVFDVASTILGGGRSSRLYRRLLEEEGIVTSIEAWIWGLKHAGTLAVEAVCAPENLERVKTEIFQEVERMTRKKVSAEELTRAKTMLITNFAYENETCSAMAATLGRYELLTRAEDALEFVSMINAVTAEDIRSVMKKYCHPERCTICTVMPEKDQGE